MKLLSKDELKGIDSTQSTIAKWHSLFQTALPNLGFKDSLLEEMYPYEAGIPLKDGGTLPVMDTGRVFYKLSWSEKLAGMLSTIYSNNQWGHWGSVMYVVVGLWASSIDVFKKFFPDATDDDFERLCISIDVDEHGGTPLYENVVRSTTAREYWSAFIHDSDIAIDGSASGLLERNHKMGYVSDTEKERIANKEQNAFVDTSMYTNEQGYIPFIFNRTLEEVFDPFPRDTVRDLIARISSASHCKVVSYDEVYLQDYLVVSLNPIDKFMCSTKQAFQSCMSISKQNEVRGTNSIHAFGLPALFPSPSVYLVFTTPGKHKNMYWEQEELEKDPADRDKEKAYKYLKMTCRALTYKGTLIKTARQYLTETIPNRVVNRDGGDTINEEARQQIGEIAESLKPNQPRLFIGRQYAAKGEDKVWAVLAEYMLARQGIATSLAFADEADKYSTWHRRHQELLPHDGTIADAYIKANKSNVTRAGALCDNKAICFDKYGYIRGIYYDNISWCFHPNFHPNCKRDYSPQANESPVKDDADHQILVGASRYGSNSVSQSYPKGELDMFKVMMGKQDYSFINQHVKLCSHCHKLIASPTPPCLPDGRYMCEDCCEELGIKRCPACNELYTPDQADKHVLYNLRELTNPKNYDELEPLILCTKQLIDCSSKQSASSICGHCGKIIERHSNYYYGSLRSTVHANFHGFNIRVRLCGECLNKAVMCDKCKRLIFLDSLADACLLLPNRRVVCPDCIDTIRMKQEKRKKLKETLSESVVEDFDSEAATDPTLLDTMVRQAEQEGVQVGNKTTLIKDVYKQINTYLQVHPDEEFPILKSSNTPLPSLATTAAGSTEVEDN